jgi:hypothetical protein
MILKRVLVGSFLAGGVFVAIIFMGVHSAWGGTLTQPLNWSISAQLLEPKPHSRPHGMRQQYAGIRRLPIGYCVMRELRPMARLRRWEFPLTRCRRTAEVRSRQVESCQSHTPHRIRGIFAVLRPAT